MTVAYLFSKVLKKLRLAAIRESSIHRTSKIESGSQVMNSTMGRHSFCGYDCDIRNCDIGAFTSIANHVVIGGGEHPSAWVAMSPVFYEGRDSVTAKFATHRRHPARRTTIGHDVWIGHGVHVKQGVTIGNGAVVGMGSVVTRDVEPYAIVAGCPARVIRHRFDDLTVRLLQETAWWDFDDATLSEFAQYFTNPKEFLVRYGKL